MLENGASKRKLEKVGGCKFILTWRASSLVGAKQIAWILPVPRHLFFLRYSMMGRANAKVFPEPVRSRAIISSLLYTGLKQFYWIGKRFLMPREMRSAWVLEVISGKDENSPSGTL